MQRVGAISLGLVIVFALLLAHAAWAQDETPVEEARTAAVRVIAYDAEGNVLRKGAGFFISVDGHVITNFHVVRNAARAEVVTWDGRSLAIKSVVAENAETGMVRVVVDAGQERFTALDLNRDGVLYREKVAVIRTDTRRVDRISIYWYLDWTVPFWHDGRVLSSYGGVPSYPIGSPIVNQRGKLVGMVGQQNERPGADSFFLPAIEAFSLKPGAATPFAEWSARYDKAWEETTDGLCSIGQAMMFKDIRKAIPYFEKAMKQDADSAKARMYYAYCLYKQRRSLPRAVEVAEQAVERDPKNPRAEYVLGIIYMPMGQFTKAIPHLEKAVKGEPRFPMGWYHLALANSVIGQREEAIGAFKQAVACQPTLGWAWYKMGWLLVNQGRDAEMAGVFEHCVRLKPEKPNSHLGLGHALYNLGSFRRAVTAYRNAEEAGGFGYSLYMFYGWSCMRSGRWEEMAHVWARGIPLKPKSAYPPNFTAWGCLGSGRLDKAQELFDLANERWDDFEQPWCGRGWVAYERGQYAEALRQFEQAVARKAEYVEALYGAGVACRRLGRLQQAREYLERTLHREPNHAGARYAMGRICLDEGDTARALAHCEVLTDLDTGLAADLLHRCTP